MIPALFVRQLAQLRVLRTMLQFKKNQLLRDPKMDPIKMELQKLIWQTCQEIKLQKAYCTPQMCQSMDLLMKYQIMFH